MSRSHARRVDELRPVRLTRHYIKHAEGSVLMEMGETRVICTATVENRVPPWLRGAGKGWVTGEYAMLPRATSQRTAREVNRGRPGGRTMEIQRLIGRALRSVVDLGSLGERSITLDCDVIQADGGTRTAAVTGAYVALADALAGVGAAEGWERLPLSDFLAAVSVGVVDDEAWLDLSYEEDSRAQVDMNVVLTGSQEVVEVQGTAEGAPFPRATLDRLLTLAEGGIAELVDWQRHVLGPEISGRIGPGKAGHARTVPGVAQ